MKHKRFANKQNRNGRRPISAKQRWRIMKRDGFKCVKCGRLASDGVELQIDHFIPVSKGGTNIDCNLRTLCGNCNAGRSADHDLNVVYVQMLFDDNEGLVDVPLFAVPAHFENSRIEDDPFMLFDRYVCNEVGFHDFMRLMSRFDLMHGKPFGSSTEKQRELANHEMLANGQIPGKAVILVTRVSENIRVRQCIARQPPSESQ